MNSRPPASTGEGPGSKQEKWVYGYSPTADGVQFHPIRQISDEEYETVGLSVRVILDVLAGPTSFSELARRDMMTTIESVSGRLGEDLRKIEEWSPEVEYRIVSVSAALRMHEEFALAAIGKRGDEAAKSAARSIFSATYDRSQPYRIMYSLRNALVHGSKGLTTLSATARMNEDGTTSTGVSINLSRANFGASDAKAPVRAEVRALPEEPELVALANLALDDLTSMRRDLEPLLYPDASAAAELIFAYAKEVNSAGYSGPHFHAHDPGDLLGNLTLIGMNEAVFNYAIAFGQRAS